MTQCPYPGCPVRFQRTEHGTLRDGMLAHYATVHPGAPVPPLLPATAQESR